ncbi:gamma-glutamylcyclotransferase [Aquibacillus halophilus]|uniref:Gamma-glutamylcyclotransferase family protein n=1 Tax=Aquibacillus halophilus TaxID=930132 RepID=A0A6A8DB84_9BACI|nr:gamma-glutamylcyclotransferase family protein [Aquibacillus halophilus]MRH42560.1 gamma-glutamylcyclotransferase [Aquibacillus halophilus]
MKGKINVFVYGTLRKHELNHHLLQNAICISTKCWTYGILYNTGHGYPTMVNESNQKVIGELYRISKEELKDLDHLEGYLEPEHMNNDYERIVSPIYFEDKTITAYTYVYPVSKVSDYKVIGTGDWKSISNR